jgi:glycosyltransferase involved in cell wall biosynthesis
LINFVSNLPNGLRSGGFSAMNAAAYDALSKLEEIHYVGPISPPSLMGEKVLSKILRTSGAKGDFFFYSSRRLELIAEEVKAGCRADARLDFFHGFTPWVLSAPSRPYVAWSDCSFHDYIDIYHQRERFRAADLDRIERAEARWLARAQSVAFTSQWAARRCIGDYRLNETAVRCVGIFGEADLPASDEYRGAKQFAFVSTNFAAKGGPAVIAAFRRVRDRHPDASLVIVGAQPSGAAAEPNIVFEGYLRKEVAAENRRLHDILGQSCALVHPTGSDIAPLIVVEAGYFGCPAISVRKFAIPELIAHKISGLLVEDAADVAALADAMSWMIEQGPAYIRMRRQAWVKAHSEHSKQAFEQKIQAMVRTALGEGANCPNA